MGPKGCVLHRNSFTDTEILKIEVVVCDGEGSFIADIALVFIDELLPIPNSTSEGSFLDKTVAPSSLGFLFIPVYTLAILTVSFVSYGKFAQIAAIPVTPKPQLALMICFCTDMQLSKLPQSSGYGG